MCDERGKIIVYRMFPKMNFEAITSVAYIREDDRVNVIETGFGYDLRWIAFTGAYDYTNRTGTAGF
jgi:hypothetical protein